MAMPRAGSNKCRAGKCGQPSTATCTARKFERNHETNEKIYSGAVCGLTLCADHVLYSGTEPRCMWHFMVDERERSAA